jgi:hypothetical protein
MNNEMDLSRHPWIAAIKLALAVSTTAALVAMLLVSIADVSQTAIVLTVIAIGFSASWVQSGRALHGTSERVVVHATAPRRHSSRV